MLGSEAFSSLSSKQRSIQKPVSVSGRGLFTGIQTNVTLKPASDNHGVVIQRVDLKNKPKLPATVEFVRGTHRCTSIGNGDVCIQTVEHILSALKAYDIDNILIEIDGSEVPGCDGSSLPFVELIEQAGIAYQDASKEVLRLQTPIFWSKEAVHLVALPSDEFRISYTLNYPHSELIRSQFYTFCVNDGTYKSEIAPARTFSLYEEIIPFIAQGKIKGGTLENAVIIKDGFVLNPKGVRFQDEMVRHKVLDLLGDLSLIGHSFLAHVIAIRSGHFSNVALAKELVNVFKMECANV